MQKDRDSVRPDDRLGDFTIDAFPEESIERRDHVGSAPALVRMIVIAPSGIVGQEPTEHVEIVGRERRTDLVSDLVERPDLDREVKATAFGGMAGNDADRSRDQATAFGAVDLHPPSVGLPFWLVEQLREVGERPGHRRSLWSLRV